MNTKELLEIMATEGLRSDNLDGLVHEQHSIEASSLNNEGLQDQVHYLVTSRGLSPEDILEEARADKEEQS